MSLMRNVLGLGNAHGASKHWLRGVWAEIALVPLAVWFVWSLLSHASSDYRHVVLWIASPITLVLLVLMIPLGFFHAVHFLRIVVEDYVHTRACRMMWYAFLTSLAYLCIAVCYFLLLNFI